MCLKWRPAKTRLSDSKDDLGGMAFGIESSDIDGKSGSLGKYTGPCAISFCSLQNMTRRWRDFRVGSARPGPGLVVVDVTSLNEGNECRRMRATDTREVWISFPNVQKGMMMEIVVMEDNC